MDGDGVHPIEDAEILHARHKCRIDWRDAPEDLGDVRVHLRDRVRRQHCHFGISTPIGIELGVPMRLVVRFVPDHRSFNHEVTPLL